MSSKNTPESKTKTSSATESASDYGVLDQSLGYLLRRAQIRAFQGFNSYFDVFEIKPAQFSALELIQNNPGMRQSRLAEALGIQRTNLVGMLDLLQSRDLIKREPAPDDRRSHALHITAKGNQLLDHLHQQFYEHEKELIQAIGEENLQTFRESLIAIGKLHLKR